MRKNKTDEILMNHFITPDVFLFPKVLKWEVEDYSSGEAKTQMMNILFPKSTDWDQKFRVSFYEARKINDSILNNGQTFSDSLENIINSDFSSIDFTEIEKCLEISIANYIAIDEFFKLPLDMLCRLIKNSNFKFKPEQAKRAIYLANQYHPGEAVRLLEVIDCGQISPLESIKIMNSIEGCPLISNITNLLGNCPSNEIAGELLVLDGKISSAKEKYLPDAQICFIGLAKLKINVDVYDGESVVAITYDSHYKMIFVLLDKKEDNIIEFNIDKYQHLHPNYETLTANGKSFAMEFTPKAMNYRIVKDFRAAQYKAKYNILPPVFVDSLVPQFK